MKKALLTILCSSLILLLLGSAVHAATEQEKQAAIDAALVWLAQTQSAAGAEGYWSYPNNGTLAATAAAALAFVEEDWLPGTDFEMGGTNYGDVVGRAVTYMLNRAVADGRFGVEFAVYTRYAEDYNNDGDFTNDGGNNQAVFFNPGASNRNVYTTGICAPTVFALGERLGKDSVIGMGSGVVSGMTWAQLMQDIVDWFSWGQVEPNRGVHRGGWRYDANYGNSDNSTAQWGALPYIYASAWGLGSPQYVKNELTMWADWVQNDASGGSGYDTPTRYVNCAKTGGLLLEFAVIGRPVSHPSVQAALGFLNGRWNTGPSGTWYGNLNHPYAMWGIYKGLSVYGLTDFVDSLGDPILVGTDMPAAIGGYTIGFAEDPATSAEDDWYSHYCQLLVDLQNPNGSWSGYSSFSGPLATAWYVNILNATDVPPPVVDVFVDIKPTSCPNPVNAGSMGVLPAAILGTEVVDVTLIDPGSIRLAGVEPLALDIPSVVEETNGEPLAVAPIRYSLEDVATPYEGDLVDCLSCSTEGPDGYMDLTLKFETEEVIMAALAMMPPDWDPTAKECLVVELTFLLNGVQYSGYDVIRLQGADDLMMDHTAAVPSTGIEAVSPNPFNPVTTIDFTLRKSGPVELKVYNLGGRLVQTLVSREMTAGRHRVVWKAERQPSGVYFMMLQADGQGFTERVTLLK